MKKYASLLLILFVGSFCFSQQKTTNNNFIPVSIYTTSFLAKKDSNPSYSSINKNLKFKSYYKFTTVSFEEVDSDQFLNSNRNLTKKATRYIYDDYKNYRDEKLLKGFLEKHDPTRWRRCNFRQPNIN
tara:strand:+ start:791 stop:1174 length:384 start_codon:yes stop_codon:yes gene_type:complete